MPTDPPRSTLTKSSPRAMVDAINHVKAYARATHIEDVKIEPTNGTPSVEMIRGVSGVLMRLKVGGGGGGISAVNCYNFGDFSEGEAAVDNVSEISFDSKYFKIHNNGGGEVQVTLRVCNSFC